MLTNFSKRIGLWAAITTAFCLIATAASAETLMMPKRDALKNTPLVIWGVSTLAATNCTIDFGDGAPIYNCLAGYDKSYIPTVHSYASGGNYTATLTVTQGATVETATVKLQVFDPTDPACNCASSPLSENYRDLKINMAIQDGLRWLWTTQNSRAANFPGNVQTNWSGIPPYTALVVLAFENQGYRLTNDNVAPTGIYEKYIVRRGLNYIIANLTTIGIGPQTAGNPCVGSGADCVGLTQNYSSQGYSAAIAALPLAGSGSLSRTNSEVLGYTNGKSYGEILQRLMNAISYGQGDVANGNGRGGWNYSFNGGWDGSVVGWNILALMDADAAGITIPAFVKNEFAFGLKAAWNNDGSLDYTADNAPGSFHISNPAKTGTALQGFSYIGSPADNVVIGGGSGAFTNWTTKKNAALSRLGTQWGGLNDAWTYLSTCGSNFLNKGCAYAMFNIFKGLKLNSVTTLAGVGRPAGPGAIPADDWYADYQDWLVNNQVLPDTTGGGHWAGGSGKTAMIFSITNDINANAAIAELILSPVALVLPDSDKFASVGLSPATGLSNPGPTFSHTVTAHAESTGGTPVPGATVTFNVISGPNAGKTGSSTTDSSGNASFTYFDTGGSGLDTVRAAIGSIQSNLVTMRWNSPPVVTVPGSQTAEATSASGADVTFTATATDVEDGSLTPTCDPPSGSTFPLGTTTVTCSVTDSGGLSDSKSFTITVEDTTPPTVTGTSVVVEATGPSGAVGTFTATATDIVDGDVTPVTCTPASGSVFAIGVNTVTCTATDAHGNTGTGTLTVTVQDTTPPAVTGSSVVVEATGPAGAVASFTATATDIVDGDVTPVTCNPPSGSVFAIGVNTVTCTATDAHGNTGTGTLTVTVQDTTPPVVTTTNVVVEATGPSSATVNYTEPTAHDLVDGNVPASCGVPQGSLFPLGTTTVTCSATDSHGNTGTATMTVTVQDTTPPVVSLNDITVFATSPAGAVVTFMAAAADIADPNPVVSCPASGDTFPIGTTQVTCTATDVSGNVGTAWANVTVLNNPPIAENDTATTNEDVQVVIDVLANDHDVDSPGLTAVILSGPSNGTLTPNPDGTFTYTPNPNYNGGDSFTYVASDDKMLTGNVATVTITVNAVNDAPVAQNDEATTTEDTPVIIGNVLANDTDIDTDHSLLTVVRIVDEPQHGTVSLDLAGNFTYTPEANYSGGDSFSYVASDGALESNVATVAITVTPVNDPPVAGADAADTDEDTPVTGNVLTNDSDPDNSGLTAALVSQPAHGTVTLNGDGTFTYTPAPNYNGEDSFTYKDSDGSLFSNVAKVDIHIKSINDNPACTAASPTIGSIWPPNHQLVSIGINGVTDVDGGPLTIRVTSIFQDEPTNTTGDGNTAIDGFGVGTPTATVRAERTGTPQIPGNGRVYHIRFSATDVQGGSCTGEVRVGVPHDQSPQRINPVDDGPLYDSTVATAFVGSSKK